MKATIEVKCIKRLPGVAVVGQILKAREGGRGCYKLDLGFTEFLVDEYTPFKDHFVVGKRLEKELKH